MVVRMGYSVVPINTNNQYEVYGVSFENKKFMYWKNKSSQLDKEVMVIFNQSYGNVSVVDGMVILSLAGLSNYADIRNAMMIFKQGILKNQSVQVQFVVGNENEQKIAESLGREIGGNYTIRNVNKRVQAVEEKLEMSRSNELSASGSQNISVERGGIQNYTIQGNHVYDNNDTLSIEEQKRLKLEEWKKDPVKWQQISGLSEQALEEALMQAVTIGKKEHRLEGASEQVSQNRVGQAAIDRAGQEDGRVNAELGIVQNNVANSNQFSAVEQRGDGVQIVNPSVTSSQISSNGTITSSGTSSSVDSSYVGQDIQLTTQEEQQREVEKEFYIDDEYNIYGVNGQLVGRVGQDGYMPNYNDNTLLKDGQVIGVIGDYKNMGRGNSNVYVKPQVRTLKKPGIQEDRAAFVSFPVILFVLSAMLLIVSGILLFIVD